MTKVAKNPKTQKGIRYGGRKKGVPNRKTRPLLEKAAELGVDPFEILLLIAKGDWERLGYKTLAEANLTLQMRQSAASDCCQYLYPKRKAIEMPITNPEDTSKEKVALMISWVKEIAED